ncbi:MAG: CTP synthase [Candidatus Asgardarchaeia archaeon]
MTKYIFITGGVMSGLGKGVTAASIAKLFQFRGYSVSMIKIDPYLNVDAGTMNPVEHGEVFVTEEVWEFKPAPNFKFRICEIDQDFGTYERFLDKNLHPMNNITSGQIYLSVVLKERIGYFLGKTIQIIPHITEEIKNRIRQIAEIQKPDILITEVGGTVGDIESMPFLEAIRQFILELPKDDAAIVHVTYVPFLKTVKQFKTKPTQHSVRMLQSAGLQPDAIVCRIEHNTWLDEDSKQKISLFSNIPKSAVVINPDLPVIYKLPLLFEEQNFGKYLISRLKLEDRNKNMKDWEATIKRIESAKGIIKIAMPGKYTSIVDSYVSINEALKHAASVFERIVEIHWIDTEKIENNPDAVKVLDNYDGILLTPGFGTRGVEGMIKCAEYAIEKNIPLLGICFGAQLLFIAFYRKIMGYLEANSTEVNPDTPYPVVDLLPEQKQIKEKGGTMRLGAHKVIIKENTKLYDAYKKKEIYERFRHRYHIIPDYAEKAEKYGLVTSAYDESGRIINAIEIKNKWLVGVQFHPEYKSRPTRPSPIYQAFINAIIKSKEKN